MVQFNLAGRTAVVTGGVKGIGLGIAQRLAESGAAVAIWDQKPSALQNASQAAEFAVVETVDVSDWDSVRRALQQTLTQLDQIDILVNNAGISGPTVA